MKPVRLFIFLWLAFAFVVPCAAQETRLKNRTGLHPVPNANGKWGFIDRAGRFRIRPQYDGAGEFSDDVAYVWKWVGNQRKNGIVDPAGKFTGLPTNDYEVTFHDGLARVQTPSGQERKYGYMDKTGRMVIEPQFFDSGHFSEGLAWAAMLREREWLYGFINKTGQFAIAPQFVYQPGDFVDGMAKVISKSTSGFIDRAGRFRILTEFEHSDAFFSEGLLAVVIGSDPPRGVYLDRDGKEVLVTPFWQRRTAWQRSLYTLRRQQLAPFSEGLAPVLSFNKLGFIDKTGKVVIEPEFRETLGFSEGLAAVKIIGSDGAYVWGYIDRAGKLVIEPRFREAQSFAGGLAQVSTFEGQRLLIDGNGKEVWQLAK
jgi:hypothetical protein